MTILISSFGGTKRPRIKCMETHVTSVSGGGATNDKKLISNYSEHKTHFQIVNFNMVHIWMGRARTKREKKEAKKNEQKNTHKLKIE